MFSLDRSVRDVLETPLNVFYPQSTVGKFLNDLGGYEVIRFGADHVRDLARHRLDSGGHQDTACEFRREPHEIVKQLLNEGRPVPSVKILLGHEGNGKILELTLGELVDIVVNLQRPFHMVAQLPGDRREFRERKSSLVQKERIEEEVASPRLLEVFVESSKKMGLCK